MITTRATLRQATRADIAGMHAVRLAVRENVLLCDDVTEAMYGREIEHTGRGWVVEVDGSIVGFCIGNVLTGNVWALFVHPDHQREGLGRQLHDTMVAWLFAKGVDTLWLSTMPRTRAQRFCEAAGWRFKTALRSGEMLYTLQPRWRQAR